MSVLLAKILYCNYWLGSEDPIVIFNTMFCSGDAHYC